MPARPNPIRTDALAIETTADSPPPGASKVTWTLIAVNTAVYLAMAVASRSERPGHEALSLAWKHDLPVAAGQVWRLLSCCFAHADLLHLVVNMWVLWRVGSVVERWIGGGSFLSLYLVAGTVGAALSYGFGPPVSIGSSGALLGLISGVLLFGHLQRRMLPPRAVAELGAPIFWWLAAAMLGFGMLWRNVDSTMHLGGLLAGLTAAPWLSPRSDRPKRLRVERLLLVAGAAAMLGTAVAALRGAVPGTAMTRRTIAALDVSLAVPAQWLSRVVDGDTVAFGSPGVPARLVVRRLRPAPESDQREAWLRAAIGGARRLGDPTPVALKSGGSAWYVALWPGDVIDSYYWFRDDDVIRLSGVVSGDRLGRYRPVFGRSAVSLERVR